MLIFSSRLSVNVGFFFFFLDAAVVTASRHCQTQSHDKKLLNCLDGKNAEKSNNRFNTLLSSTSVQSGVFILI